MFGGSSTQSQQPEALKGIRVQTSTYGGVRPLVYGTARLAGNLVWYGDFKALEQRSESGGK